MNEDEIFKNYAMIALAADHDATVERQSRMMADEILSDLCDRSGVGNALLNVKDTDPETWNEIQTSISRIALKYLP